MYIISFYFPISEISKILEYINYIGQCFQKNFWTPFDGVAYTDFQKFLKLSENSHNEIYYVPTINDNWPSNHIKLWNDSFSISLIIPFSFFNEMKKEYIKMETEEDFKKFSYDVKKNINQIINDLPILWVHFSEWDEPFENWWKALLDEKVSEWIIFWYVREKNEFRFIEWKI